MAGPGTKGTAQYRGTEGLKGLTCPQPLMDEEGL
jgi:hypothetical protein